MHSPEPRSPSGIAGPRRPGRSISSLGRPAVQSGSRGTHGPPPRPLEPTENTHSRGTTPRNGGVGLGQAGAGGRAGGPAESGAGAGRGRSRGVGGWPASSGAQGRGGPPPASPGRSVPSGAGLAAPPSPEVPGRDPELPPPRGAATRGRRHCSGWYQRAEKKLGLPSPQVRDTSQRRPPLALSPTRFCASQHPHPQTSHRRGPGSRRPDETQLKLRETESRGGGRQEASAAPVPGAAPARPLPNQASAEGPGAPPASGTRPGGPGRVAGAEVRAEKGRRDQEPPSVPRGASERWGLGGAAGARGRRGFRGRAAGWRPTHLPAGAAARARGQRGAAPRVHVVGDAQHPQEGEAEQHPRAPPHPPDSAAGRGRCSRVCLGPRRARAGEERRKGKGEAAPPPARLAARAVRARRPSSAPAGSAAPRPSRKRRPRRWRGGSGSKGRPIGGGCGGPARAEEGITASPRRRRAGPAGRASAGRRPATPVSDRWPPGARGARAHVRTHTGARTRDPRSPLPRAARPGAPLPRSSVFGTTAAPWQARSYWPTDLSFLVQIPLRDPTWLLLAAVFLLILQQNIPVPQVSILFIYLGRGGVLEVETER